jgi:hypothetical protein
MSDLPERTTQLDHYERSIGKPPQNPLRSEETALSPSMTRGMCTLEVAAMKSGISGENMNSLFELPQEEIALNRVSVNY